METIIDTVLDLLRKPEVAENLKETARIYYSDETVTINLIWSIIILGLVALSEFVNDQIFFKDFNTNIFQFLSLSLVFLCWRTS